MPPDQRGHNVLVWRTNSPEAHRELSSRGNLGWNSQAFASGAELSKSLQSEHNNSNELPKESPVTLKVFILLGEEVATLDEGVRPAGVYTVQFDASRLVSGVYFFRLQVGRCVETKKIVLIR